MSVLLKDWLSEGHIELNSSDSCDERDWHMSRDSRPTPGLHLAVVGGTEAPEWARDAADVCGVSRLEGRVSKGRPRRRE